MNMGTEHKQKEQDAHQQLEALIERGRMLHSQAIYLTFARMVAHLKQKPVPTATLHRRKQGLDFS